MVAAAIFLWMAGPETGQWTLKSGTKVSFVFVLPSQKQVWRPSGTPVDYSAIPKPSLPVWSGKDSGTFMVAITNPGKGAGVQPSVRFKLPDTEQMEAGFTVLSTNNKLWCSGLRPSAALPVMQDLAVGIADDPWKTVGWVEFKKNGKRVLASKVHGEDFKVEVTGTPKAHTAGPFTMVAAQDVPGFAGLAKRFVVHTRSGSEMSFSGSYRLPDKKGTTSYCFQGDVLDVGRVEMQTRPYEWTTIKVAHFRPNPK